MNALYTIGHGRHPFDYFLGLLRQHRIEFVIDVRAFARSRWPQFNGEVLRALLNKNSVGYEHIPETGGKNKPKPEDLEWGLSRIIEIAADARAVMMCSESKPLSDHKLPRANCHRVGMLAPLLKDKGLRRIIHVLPNGETLELDESTVPSIW